MTEKLLQYIWQFQYFNRAHLQTTGGDTIQIYFQGKLNLNQGPDFLDAKIKIGDVVFAGSVELHLKTSEWNRHRHQTDDNYNNVVLHVVLHHDVFQNAIPILELGSRIPTLLVDRYALLMEKTAFIPCAGSIAQARELTWISWKERLIAERLSRKATAVLQTLMQTSLHWEETFWRLLARTFGSNINGVAFEEIASTISPIMLAKQRSSIVQLEALLLGQANLLKGEPADSYSVLLHREYNFLKAKYNLVPINTPVHFLRMRPGNFPTVRLAQLAMLVHSRSHLFSAVIEAPDLNRVKAILQVTASEYWHVHYRPAHAGAYKPKKLGDSMIDTIIINAIVPTLFAYGMHTNQEAFKERAVAWLEQTAAENNSVTANFVQLSVSNKSAYDSQALLELKQVYCNEKRCLQCAIGNAILKACI